MSLRSPSTRAFDHIVNSSFVGGDKLWGELSRVLHRQKRLGRYPCNAFAMRVTDCLIWQGNGEVVLLS